MTKIHDIQFEFMAVQGTTDAIFIIRQLQKIRVKAPQLFWWGISEEKVDDYPAFSCSISQTEL